MLGQKLLQLSRLKLPGAALDLSDSALDSISADGGEVTFADVKANPTLQTSLNQSIERLTAVFEKALQPELQTGGRVFIAFDRIDEAWDASSFESSQRIIAGLIGASEYITSYFNGRVRPLVFLREDIFETVDINDRNKLRTDCGQLLAWSKDGLARMILDRVNFFAKRASVSPIEKVEDLFDRDQMRQQRAPFDYIMLRTMLRPRDFIRLFQLVKSDMKERRDSPYDAEQVSSESLECQSIYNAEPAYSEWLVEELKDEWRAQYPRIKDLFSAIQTNGKTNISAGDLLEAMKRNGAPVNEGEVNGYLRFLFDNSIIGFRVGNSQQWRYKCFFKSQGFIDSEIYKVHDGLHRGLSLTESRSQA